MNNKPKTVAQMNGCLTINGRKQRKKKNTVEHLDVNDNTAQCTCLLNKTHAIVKLARIYIKAFLFSYIQ